MAMQTRLGATRGQRARALITTTPKPMELLERIRDDRWTVTTSGRTSDNINLDEKFIEIGRRMAERVPRGELVVVGGGHGLVLENPQAVARVLEGRA